MATLVNLPCTRFVRQASNGCLLSCYGYTEMMRRNAEAIKNMYWRKARCNTNEVSLIVNQVTKTDGVYSTASNKWTKEPSYTAWIDDRYDVFAQGGDGVLGTDMMCGYAGCVAYRFTLPQFQESEIFPGIGAFNTKLYPFLKIYRDRYLRAGVRVSATLSDSEVPSEDWSVIRPNGDLRSDWKFDKSPKDLIPEGVTNDWMSKAIWRMVYLGPTDGYGTPPVTWAWYLFAIDPEDSDEPDHIIVRKYLRGVGYYGPFVEGQSNSNTKASISNIDITVRHHGLDIDATINCRRSHSYVSCSTSEVANDVVGVSSWGVLGQKPENFTEYVKDTKPYDIEYSISPIEQDSDFDYAKHYKYLYVYMTLENPDAYWQWYAENEARMYNIEGSAMISPMESGISFVGDIDNVTDTEWKKGNENFFTIRDCISSNINLKKLAVYLGDKLFSLNYMAGFLFLKGRLCILAMNFSRSIESMNRTFLIGDGGGSGFLEYDDGMSFECGYISSGSTGGNPSAFISLTEMEKFGNWPDISLMSGQQCHIMVASRYCPSNVEGGMPRIACIKSGGDVSVSAIQGYSQFVFGYAPVVVPEYKPQYTEIKIARGHMENEGIPICENVDISFNVWVSESASAIGRHAQAAFAALSQNPEFFTGSKLEISGTCSFNMNDYEKNEPSETVNIDVKARLIGNISARNILYNVDGDSDHSMILSGVLVKPGDVVIVTPKVERISGISNDCDNVFVGSEKPEDGESFLYTNGVPIDIMFK